MNGKPTRYRHQEVVTDQSLLQLLLVDAHFSMTSDWRAVMLPAIQKPC